MSTASVPCTAGVHGSLYAYRRHGCRCPEARQARGEDSARYRRAAGMRQAPPTVPAGRYVRLLRELLEGRTQVDVADRLGWSESWVSALLRARRMHRPTADRIAELHTLLVAGRPGPRSRWEPADPVLVERAADGEVPWRQLPEADRAEAVALLGRRGESAWESGERLGVSSRAVQRWRSRDATQPATPV